MDDRSHSRPDSDRNGWDQHKRLVLYRLDGIEASLDRLRAQVESMHRQQVAHATTLRITAAAIGAVAGLIPALLSFFLSRGV